MDINELESYRLQDAVKFHKQLNPRLWGADEHLQPDVKNKLLAIADDFCEFLGITGLEIKDITVSGSNAAYTYTDHSDIDLHIVVDLPESKTSDIYQELFDAKKYQYNDQHDFKIGGYDVELYVQDANETHHSQGIYSLLNNDWVRVPSRRQPSIDDISVRNKYEDIGHRIDAAIKSGSGEQLENIATKVRTMRQSGLDKTGEFGPENLAFKILRNNGTLDILRQARLAAKDRKMSLEAQSQPKERKKYGHFGGMWFPDTHDAVVDETELVKENPLPKDIKEILPPFVKSCAEYLKIEKTPKIILKRDPEWTRRNGTFGRFDPDTHSVTLAVSNRHPLDILRTLAHELTHARQDELATMPVDAGETGSPYEDDANAQAGRIMRYWVDKHPEFFKDIPLEEDYDPNGPPPGPETKPTMPKGTVRVDVSDMYDWYKLGKDISNLKGADKSQFGKGPPSTIVSFGDENTEHKYIKDLEHLGLTTTDIDPVDPDQPKNMPRQKVDPTFNVNESLDQPYKILRWEKGDHGDVDAIARLDDNTFLSVMFTKGFSQDTKEEAWSVEFYRNNSQEKTGEGDQQRVFATVLSAIQTFISDRVPGAKGRYKPNKIYFSASKEVKPDEDQRKAMTRARLYDSLVQRYARALGFRAFRADTGNKVMYELSRIKPVAEGREKFNLDVLKPGFRWSEEINGITYLVRTQWDNMPEVVAKVNNREVGRATFTDHSTRSGLESVSTYVSPKWQGHGIAKNMYAVMRMLGANIQPSETQTAMGQDMWAKWKKAGDTKHLTSLNAKSDQPGLEENMDHSKDSQAVEELKAALIARKQKLQSANDDQVYDTIDSIMTRIAKSHSISGQQLHDMWVDKYKQIPDTWIMHENFADGKNPGRKGLAKRVGVNTKASVSSLRKTAKHSTGEKQRMAHWLANMKAGKAKHEGVAEDIADESVLGFLTKYNAPGDRKSKASSAEMRKYFDKEKSKEPAKFNNDNKQEPQKVYVRSNEDLDEAVGDNYLYHATMPAGLMRILRTGVIKATDRPQPSTKARTQYPTISTTRSKQYAESNEFVDFLNLTKDGNAVILVFDRNAVANHYKMFGTSQGTQTVGDEFEEVIVAPQGSMPIRGTLKGFYFNPNRTAEIQEYQDVPWFQELLTSPYYMGKKLNEATGFIPVDSKLAHDPRYVSGLTVDIKPGETQRQAKKLGWTIDKNGNPPLLMQELERQWKIIKEGREDLAEQDLFEIKMTGKNLQAEAAKTGAQAGMEFEMIVPNLENDDEDSGDMEPDYEYDESVNSIQDAYDFFYDGDYNSRGDVTRLREKMQNEYYEWLSEQFDSYWESNEFELIYNYIKENASDEEIAEILGTEPDENGEYPDANKQSRVDATDKVIGEGYSNSWYEQAQEDAQEDFRNSANQESEWLEDRELNTMSDIENEYEINWPHWQSMGGGGGELTIDDFADEFSRMIGKPINSSKRYHGARREAGHYVVEPDGSLTPDDSNDGGLEFVSPPMPIDEMISDFNKVVAWAKKRGCYTNDSTGLHINVSVPNFDRRRLDFVKLAILMGDEYILDQFGRNGNFYTKSAMKIVKDRIAQEPANAQALLDKMKGQVEELASRSIHAGYTDKYTSINVKDGYIEFRSPGGDWLDSNLDKVENTLLRFTVALNAAMNPEMYREEYLKKLYKILAPEGSDDSIKYFAKYAAGELPQSALKSFVRQAQLERKLKADPTNGEKYWWRVDKEGRGKSGASFEVVATSKEEALEKAASNWMTKLSALSQAAVYPIKPYDDSPIKATVGAPQPAGSVGRATTSFNGQWKIIDGLGRQLTVFRPYENTRAAANELAAIWARENEFDGNYQVEPADEQQSTPATGSTTDLAQQRSTPGTFTGAWRVVDSDTGQELYRFSGVGNVQADANRVAADWLRQNAPEDSDMTQIEVLPIVS
jgi:hypothetical protein